MYVIQTTARACLPPIYIKLGILPKCVQLSFFRVPCLAQDTTSRRGCRPDQDNTNTTNTVQNSLCLGLKVFSTLKKRKDNARKGHPGQSILLFRLLHPCGGRCQTTEMIAWIEGQVRDIQETGLLISVSGIGYEVFAPRSTLDQCKKGQVVALYTRLIVREDAWLLYGFHETDLRQVFDLLISVSGIGPKLALALLSQLKLSILARAIAEADVGLLSSVSGVGKKTAERLALELQNKLPISLIADASSRGTETSPASVAIAQDAIGALVALGYRETQVRQVVAKLLSEDPNLVTDQLIRKGLGQLR